MKHVLAAVSCAAISVAALGTAFATAPASLYLLGCGGCHGAQGRSYAPLVPDLAGQAGYYLCTPEGRSYIARLPNVAFAHLSDADLARVMNYVVFTLGGRSAPAGTPPYSAAEMAARRAHPIDTPALLAMRAGIVTGVLAACPSGTGLLDYGAR